MNHRVSHRSNKDAIKAEDQPAQFYGISLSYNLFSLQCAACCLNSHYKFLLSLAPNYQLSSQRRNSALVKPALQTQTIQRLTKDLLELNRKAKSKTASLPLMEVIINSRLPTEKPLSMMHGKVSRT